MADKEYIERKLAKDKFSDLLPIGRSIRDTIDEVPAADVVEVRHGRWKRLPFGMFYCSECREIHRKKRWMPNYCHNCGANMKRKDGQL